MVAISNRHDAEAWASERQAAYESRGELPVPDELSGRLESLRDKYAGTRIFIIGNGPSLNRTNLDHLSSEFTFAVNKFYLLYDRIVWTPSFYTALDWRVVPDIFQHINGLSGPTKFLDYRYYGLLTDSSDAVWYSHAGANDARIRSQGFSSDATQGLVGAGSVVGSAIQLAYFMGFDPIYLIGCDLGYKVPASVVQEGPDKFGNGVGVHLTSTADDDSNHFSSKYFGAGARWHDPNVKRMIAGHQACRRYIESQGRSIINATVGGELEVYPRVDFDTLFPSTNTLGMPTDAIRFEKVGPYARTSLLSMDESDLVRRLSSQLPLGERPTMIDVGAHVGSSSLPFYADGWDIHAFEPDPRNREILERSVKDARPGFSSDGHPAAFTVTEAAVSNHSVAAAPFFRSELSSGISGLHRFVSDHKLAAHVPTVRLDEYMERASLSTCTYLKIDTEGHDLFVLDSFPFWSTRPAFVVVEFDDGKTLPLGYSCGTLAERLSGHGYVVLASEWYPITQYGDIHVWKSLSRWGSRTVDPKGWGNLIAVDGAAWHRIAPELGTAITGAVADATELAARRRRSTQHPGARRRRAELPKRGSSPSTLQTGRTEVVPTHRSRTPRVSARRLPAVTSVRLRGVPVRLSLVATAYLERHITTAKALYSAIRRSETLRNMARRCYQSAPPPVKASIDRIVVGTGLYG